MFHRPRISILRWIGLVLAILPATALVAILIPLGAAASAGLMFAALAHIGARDLAGLGLDLRVLAWLGGSILGATCGVAALWLVTFVRREEIDHTPRLRGFVFLGLIAGIVDAGLWLGFAHGVRESPFYAVPLVMAGIAATRNVAVLTIRRRGSEAPGPPTE